MNRPTNIALFLCCKKALLIISGTGFPGAGPRSPAPSLQAGSLQAGSLQAGSLQQGSLQQGSLQQGSLQQGSLQPGTSMEELLKGVPPNVAIKNINDQQAGTQVSDGIFVPNIQ